MMAQKSNYIILRERVAELKSDHQGRSDWFWFSLYQEQITRIQRGLQSRPKAGDPAERALLDAAAISIILLEMRQDALEGK